MKASEFGEDILYCHVCGFIAKARLGKNRKLIPAFKVLAGHILASRHKNKRWAANVIFLKRDDRLQKENP